MPHSYSSGSNKTNLIRKVDLKNFLILCASPENEHIRLTKKQSIWKSRKNLHGNTPQYDSKIIGLQFIHNFLCFSSYPHGIWFFLLLFLQSFLRFGLDHRQRFSILQSDLFHFFLLWNLVLNCHPSLHLQPPSICTKIDSICLDTMSTMLDNVALWASHNSDAMLLVQPIFPRCAVGSTTNGLHFANHFLCFSFHSGYIRFLLLGTSQQRAKDAIYGFF